MRYLPVHLDLRLREALVVGGNEIALRKAETLAAAGARVSVIAANSIAEIQSAADAGKLRLISRGFRPEDVRDAGLVIAVDDAATDLSAVSIAARAADVPVNVVDRPDLSTFVMPAIVDRGDIVVGISTGGDAPVLARKLREQIEAILPSRLGDLARFAGQFRDAVRGVMPDLVQRRRFWERFFDSPVAEAVLAGEDRRAREAMLPLVNRPERSGSESGAIYIVGAGPGDADLLTLRALRLLQQADIVFYDELVGEDVIGRIRRDAERVYVGKEAGAHAVPQEQINAMLVREAKRGRRVLRLKGGDPFVFGRGGEELEFARRHGFEPILVPGITAALGCAAAAAIPLTHRDLASGVSFITGHGKDGALGADWQALAQSGNTIVVYMGHRHAAEIGAKLIAAGLPAGTPVAAILNGTRRDQRINSGMLVDLGQVADFGQESGPVLLVIGEVVRLTHAWAPPSLVWTAAW